MKVPVFDEGSRDYLFDAVIDQIMSDSDTLNFQAVHELLEAIPDEKLYRFLGEEIREKLHGYLVETDD